MAGLAAALWTILTLWEARAAVWLLLEYDADAGTRLRLRVGLADMKPIWERPLYGPGVPLRPEQEKRSPGKAAWRAVRALAGRRETSASVRARVCTGDAASTAIVCGAIESLNALAAREGIRLSAAPEYGSGKTRIVAEARLRAKAGHIALAFGQYLLAARGEEQNP